MSGQVGNQNVGFLMTRLICAAVIDRPFIRPVQVSKSLFTGDLIKEQRIKMSIIFYVAVILYFFIRNDNVPYM